MISGGGGGNAKLGDWISQPHTKHAALIAHRSRLRHAQKALHLHSKQQHTTPPEYSQTLSGVQLDAK